MAVVLLSSLGSIGIGAAVTAYAVLRDRPDEIVAGLLMALTSLALLGWAVRRPTTTLPVLVTVGWLLQLFGVLFYYYAGFAQDANLYHVAGMRALEGQPMFEWSGTGWSNWMMATLVAGIYRVIGVSQLGGFVVFAVVGFSAKVIAVRTMLHLRPLLGRSADAAAVAIIIFPSLTLWLSAITKEAFAVLGVALVLAGLARPLSERPRVALIALGLASTALTRPHVALLLAISALTFTVFLLGSSSYSFGRRFWLVTGALVFGYIALTVAGDFFGVEPTVSGFEEVRTELAETRFGGGSEIEARPVRSPLDLPAATATVLFRPHLLEVHNATSLMQALENTLLAAILVWLLLQRRRRRENRATGAAVRHVRSLRTFAWVYLGLFIYSFSGMYNLGLMSRQRTQVILVLLLLMATSLTGTRGREPSRSDAPPAGPPVAAGGTAR
jgi:hypothetical protein